MSLIEQKQSNSSIKSSNILLINMILIMTQVLIILYFFYYFTEFEQKVWNGAIKKKDSFSNIGIEESSISPICCTSSAGNAGNSGIQIHLKIHIWDVSFVIFMSISSNLVKWMIKARQSTSIHENAPCNSTFQFNNYNIKVGGKCT